MATALDPDQLAHARDMAGRLTDEQLASELRQDRTAFRPEAWQALEEEARRRRSKSRTRPILSTTQTVSRPIRSVLGIVGSEYVMGVDLFQEFLAHIRDMVGGRSQTIQAAFAHARETLLEELSDKGQALRADAVIGIAFTLSEWSAGKSMLLLLATGTAVTLDNPEPAA